jgi:hypothetical protein
MYMVGCSSTQTLKSDIYLICFCISCCILLSLWFIATLISSLPEEHNLVYPGCCARYFLPCVPDLLSVYTLVLAAFEALTKHQVGLHYTNISSSIIVSFFDCWFPHSLFPTFCIGLTHALSYVLRGTLAVCKKDECKHIPRLRGVRFDDPPRKAKIRE